MAKRKAEEDWVEDPEVREVDTEPSSANVAEEGESAVGVQCPHDTRVPTKLMTTHAKPGVNKVANQEVHASKKIWQLLMDAGYECW